MDLELNNVLIYGICLSSCLLLKILLPYLPLVCPLLLELVKCPPLPRVGRSTTLWTYKYLIYRTVVRARRWCGGWSRFDVLLLVMYLAANISCTLIGVSSVLEAGARAGALCLCNMLPLFAAPSLSFAADILQVSLRDQRRLHVLAGVAVVLLAAFHVTVSAASSEGYPLTDVKNVSAFGAIICIGSLSLPIGFLSRLLPFELVSTGHHLLALTLVGTTWHHLPSKHLQPRLYIYVVAGAYALALAAHGVWASYRNKLWFSRARLTEQYGLIHMNLHSRRKLAAEPGQYLNMWIIEGVRSILQVTPLLVVSWAPEATDEAELILQVRQGLTRKLLKSLEYGDNTVRVAYSGPHGPTIPTDKHEYFLLLATGSGILPMLPFLKKLVSHRHGHRRSCTRRVRLVWRVEDEGLADVVEKYINSALEEDDKPPPSGEYAEIAKLRHCLNCGGRHDEILDLTFYMKRPCKPPAYEASTAPTEKLVKPEQEALQSVHASGCTDADAEKKKKPRARFKLVEDLDFGAIVGDETKLVKNPPVRAPLLVIAAIARPFREELTEAVRAHLQSVILRFAEFEPPAETKKEGKLPKDENINIDMAKQVRDDIMGKTSP
ncbi:uncharacterized protein F5Z01DRAFT_729974 [Emericellopsis atlantica]|uniref:Ferric reductase NAD binding domain-containing protein n=1 Tax=Emericellopsis atlantica TaxID=2614577 RepID=A0A9P7ZEW8_9HYPO|nr:uncharacterized protein F5Z01DRAFT_729974 [Emericellopsis atlantica]KAG9250676.1 hypothetical protein F5Z01DRAFT_729974 [Emericellopsis atlantica]